jgi:exodeoxyribonuclease VII large subunit
MISDHKAEIERKLLYLMNYTLTILGKLKVRNDGFANTLSMLDPEKVLKRGYTITSLNGIILKRVLEVSIDDTIETRFCDGRIKSKVTRS